MGFGKLEDGDMVIWVFELPLSKMLVVAASVLSDSESISSSSTRGKELTKDGVVSVGGESYSKVW